jgi:ribose transport system permease protein
VTVAAADPGTNLPAAGPSAAARRSVARRFLGSRVTALALFDLVFIAAIGAIEPDFVRLENFKVIVENMALPAMVMVPTVYLLAAGRFDLSVDGVAVLSGIVAGLLLKNEGAPTLVALVLGVGVGFAFGLANGLLIELAGLNPLVTTLGTWWVAMGLALGLTQGYSPFGFPSGFTAIGQTKVLGVLIVVVYAVVFVAAMAALLGLTRFGAHVYATGGDREAALLNGVKVKRIGVVLYALAGTLAGAAGVIFAARLGTASASAFDGLALDVIAAAVVGGASLTGGRGTVLGGLLGLFLLNLFGSAAIYVGISPFWQKGISGLILLVALVADALADRRQRRPPSHLGTQAGGEGSERAATT